MKDFKDAVVYATEVNAAAVLESMRDLLKEYGEVRLCDFFDLTGCNTLDQTYVDTVYGWTNLDDVEVKYNVVHGWYYLTLPDPSPLPEKKEVEQTNNGWISVKDRLPELYKDVWIYVPKYGVRQGYRIEQVIYADNLEYMRKIYWKEFGLEIYLQETEVTHWMPLPEPPKAPNLE